MREIKKVDASQTPKAKADRTGSSSEITPSVSATSSTNTENLGTGPSSLVGQAQVIKDNAAKDLNFMANHLDAVDKSEQLFDLTFKALREQDDPQAYEKACAISTSAARELFS